jgi:hypothetical protein
MPQIIASCYDYFSLFRYAWHKICFRRRRSLSAVCAVIFVMIGGCKEDPTIWSAQVQSPDGSWFAYAHTVQHSGAGADGVETIVEIKRMNGSKSWIRVLGFADDGSSMALKMDWVTPSNLEVVFRDEPNVLYYELVKTSGVQITVRDLAEPQTSTQ